MHNNIMAAGSKDRPPMLGPGRYSQWRSPVAAAENIPPVAAHEEAETIHNMTTENKLYFQAEKEAIFLILTGIGDEKFTSTVDACKQLRRCGQLLKGYNREQLGKFAPMQVNVQYFTNFNQMSKIVTVVKQREEIDTVSYHRLFDVLKQFQNEVNDIRSERLARSANPLALLAAAQQFNNY
ncbi:hypothetical protein Tco_0978352 [Tanacetum coccineum]|uniref:Gag protein n=1 Tax=Tanacetum coccineum TaxID=301880 RepID=A0ABQ5EMU2_9ASTR